MKKILLTILIIITPLFSFAQIATNDFGDAPESYGLASHYIILTTRYLGTQPDAEGTPQYSQEADGDDRSGNDDEDGVTFPDMIQGTKVTVRIDIVGSGRLNGWMDWNGDGDFDDFNEKVANNISRTSGSFNLSGQCTGGCYSFQAGLCPFQIRTKWLEQYRICHLRRG